MKYFILVIVCFLTFPVQAKILDVEIVKSKSGITAWLVEDHTVPVISMQVLFKGAGAINDPENKQGLSQILSNTLDEGAGDMDSRSFQEKLNNLSIGLGFQASRDNFGASLKTLSKYKHDAFDMLRLSLTSPRFETDAVQRMIASNLVRIRSNMTDPEWLNARLGFGVIYGDHPYALNVGGTITTLQSITPDDLRQKFKTQLAQSNLVVTVAGDMTAEELAIELDRIFGALPKTADIKKISESSWDSTSASTTLYHMDIPQTIVTMALPGIRHTDPDYAAAEVMDFIFGSSGFGSRLTEEVREKQGLTYGIYSRLGEMDYATNLSISSSTRNETVQTLIDVTRTVMQDMTRQLVTEKELKDAKTYLVGSVPLQLTSTDAIAGLMMGLMRDGLSPDYLEMRAAKIISVTGDDVLRVAQRLLKPEDLKIILVGNPKLSHTPHSISKIPHIE